MSTEKANNTKKTDGDFDIFIAESIYPEVEPIFAATYKTVDEIKDDCLVVLDTNALLVPYLVGKDSLEQIRVTYEKLVLEKRLVIPAQVAREFAKNRANKLAELYQQFNRKISNMQPMQKGKYPLLESLDAYERTLRLEARIDKLMLDYKKTVQEVLSHIRNWTWNDPVSAMYSSLFTSTVLMENTVNKQKVEEELSRRQLHGIPPGYKDGSKVDSGIGDYLIWLSILEAGKRHNQSLLFVSGEEKPDWFHKSEGQALYPRYELVDEYRRNSDGHTFHIVSFARFLTLYGVSKSAVEEVRQEEKRLNLESSVIGEFVQKWAEFEDALYNKCIEVNPEEVERNRSSAGRMIQVLARHEAVSSGFIHLAREVTDLRNRTMHGRTGFSSHALRTAIESLDELMDELY